jgi:hypothetical protein
MASLGTWSALLASAALTLGGCNSLLGDFKYDPNFTGVTGTGGGPSADEQGNIVILPAAGLVTTERGGKATFTISLKVKPTSNVAIVLSSSNLAEGTVSPISVSFTPENFDAPQMVQVTGVDDTLPDKTQTYTIKTSPASSEDPVYVGIDPLDVQVRNVDDETAGVTLVPPSGLVTTESGGEAMLGIVLNHAPAADVTIGLSSDRPTEGTVSPPSLIFTPLNWMAPQMVTITGVNDDVADGEQAYSVVTAPIVSADPEYNGFDADDALVKNQDNDSAGVTLTPSTGLRTSETGDMTTFGVALNSPPVSDVRITLTSNDPAEGTALPESLIFTPLNWMAPQTVTVTGVNDDRSDGNQPYQIVTNPAESDDPAYDGHDGPNAEVTNIDDDSPGITALLPGVDLATSEDGSAVTFTVVLNSKPSGDVLLDVSSSNVAEGVISPALLTFTETNWNAPQTVTVTGIDDDVADGMQPYTVHVRPSAASVDAAYAALLETDVPVWNTDDDSAGIKVIAPNQPLQTREWGESATFQVVLNSKPTADVTIALTSSDLTEGTVSPAALVFTVDNWKAPQTVTAKGVNDDVADGHQPYKIITEDAVSQDPMYSGKIADNVDLTNIDGDTPGITVTPANQQLTTHENGASATFQVYLNSEPTGDVIIPVASSNTAEGTVSTASLKFTTSNWRAAQTVTVKGVDDDGTADGDQLYRVTLGLATSTDTKYLIDPPDITVKNVDSDQPGISLRNADLLSTKENGAIATFQIFLNSRPTQTVTIGLSSTRTSEGTVSPAAVTFTRDNWSAPQTVTVKGVDEKIADGDQPYRITTAPAQSADPKYSGLDVADVPVTNLDDDTPGVIVTLPAGGLSTREGGGTGTFTIELKSQPTADVTLSLSSSRPSEGTVSPTSLTFTALNWNAKRTITATGGEDSIADGNQPYTIVIAPATSQDALYNGRFGSDVPATNQDDDTPHIVVSAVSNDTTEWGTSASFTIRLGSQPKADVTIPVVSLAPKEGTASPASVTFTALSWQAPQKITITPVNDEVEDGNQLFTVDLGKATSSDPGYNGLDGGEVELSNIDDDIAGVLVSAASGNTSELGGTATFTIVLTSQPTASVTIPLASTNLAEGTLSVASVTFSTTDYGSAKTITVTGVDDEPSDGDQSYSIAVGAATSMDGNYAGIDGPDVMIKNVDDDSAGLNISDTDGGMTGEKATAADFTFTVALTSKPAGSVAIPLSSSDVGEGAVTPSSLVFTAANWKSPQTVTVSGVDDQVQDGNQPYAVVLGKPTSTDGDYDALEPVSIPMSNVDDDMAGVDVGMADGSTTEMGATAKFPVVLRTKPAANVIIPLSSGDETEGTVTPASLTFTPDNWNVVQFVTAHGENDDEEDGNRSYTILTGVISSTDNNYKGMNPDDVTLLNVDDDVAGIQVSLISGPTTEAGGSATFTIVLSTEPTGLVSIPVSSSAVDEGTVSVTMVEFTTADWDEVQTITVQGADDALADGTQEYAILLGKPVTADANYGAIDPDDVKVSNSDDEPAAE